MTRILNLLVGTVTFAIFVQPDEVVSLPVRLLVFLIGFGLIGLMQYLQERREQAENDAKPVISVKAAVSGRRSMMVGSRKHRRMAYYLTFRTEDGSQLEFEVSELEFGRHEMGEEGTLEYRGWQYLGLRRYDLGGMAPVIQPEDQKEPDPPAEKLNGILTHELEE